MTPTASLAIVVWALGQVRLFASGEVFHLKQRPIPGPYSLKGLTAFSVYVPPDGPTAQAGDSPFVEFEGQAYNTDTNMIDWELQHYESIQLSLVHMDDYDQYIGKRLLCNADKELSCPEGASMPTYTVRFNKNQSVHSAIERTGTYFLLMSNCGDVSQAAVSGRVAVRNPFGFMSGTQYHKLIFYGYSTILYMALAVIWSVRCVTWRQEFIAIHAIVGLVIGLKLLECVSWTLHLYTMNMTGDESDFMVYILVMFTTLTSYTSYIFVLVISQGWRMTDEVVDYWMLSKIGFLGVIWSVINYVREDAMVHRQTSHLPPRYMTMTAIGSMTINAIVVIWILVSLARLSENLKERSLDDQHKAVSRFTVALIVAVVASVMVASIKLMDSLGSLQVAWKYQYLIDGGIQQVIFACVVVVAMWAWMPSAGSGQLGYSAPVGQNDEDGLWKEDGANEDVEASGGSPGQSRQQVRPGRWRRAPRIAADDDGGNKVAPNIVGATDDDL